MGKWIAEMDLNNDIWHGDSFDTKEEAIEDGRKQAIEEGLNKFKIGETEQPTNFGIDADQVIENIQCAMCEDVGEVAEDYLEYISTESILELEKELNEVFFEWQKRHGCEPTFYKIINEQIIDV